MSFEETAKSIFFGIKDNIISYYTGPATFEQKAVITLIIVLIFVVILLWLNHLFDVWEGNSRNTLVKNLLIGLVVFGIFVFYLWMRKDNFSLLDGSLSFVGIN